MPQQREISIGDIANVDSFSRMRVSQPAFVFDAQLTYDLHPLLFEQVTAETGAAIAHDDDDRSAVMTFADTPADGMAYMQTYEHFRYQAGRSHLCMVTFNFIEAATGVTKFAGYSDGVNGIEFQNAAGVNQWAIYNAGSVGNQTAIQSAWNLDKLDGTGRSGVDLDITKVQIAVIDLQALYVGRVRVGFDVDGAIIYVHEFLHANLIAAPYIQTANLPVRCGMTTTATVSTTMLFICSTVISEGGEVEVGGYNVSHAASLTAGSGARTHVMSLRPLTTFNSIVNRAKFIIESLEIIAVGNNPIFGELVLGQAITGTTTYTAVNATYSAFEYNTAGTLSGNPAIVIASGYVGATATSKGTLSAKVNNRYPITLNAAGAVRGLGTLTLMATGIGGTSAMQAAINWRELR